MPLWFWLALAAALATALTDTILKGCLKGFDPEEMALVRFCAPFPFLLPSILVWPMPELGLEFWLTVLTLIPLEILAMSLYMKALKASPLSLSIPLLAFTPSFIIVTGWLILRESVSPRGLLGIAFTVSGAYIIHCRLEKGGLASPLLALINTKGSRYMLLVAIIYSITSCLGKRAIIQSSPVFFAPFYFSVLGLVVPVVFSLIWRQNAFLRMLRKIRDRQAGGMGKWPAILAIGLLQSLMVYSHMLAISLANAAYMIAVKRTSLLFSILLGCLVLREESLGLRLLGGVTMLMGVYLVATA